MRRQAVARATPPPLATWRCMGIITRELFVVTTLANVTAAALVVLNGWGNVYANDQSASALQRFTLGLVAATTVVGNLAVCPLVAFILRAQSLRQSPASPLSMARCIWLTTTQSWRAHVIVPIGAVALTAALMALRVPVVRYNLHSLIVGVAVQLLAIRLGSNTRQCCRQLKSSASSIVPAQPSPQRQPSTTTSTTTGWQQDVQAALRISLPSTLSAILTIQFITAARRIRLESTESIVLFALVCAVLKAIAPFLTKLFIAQQQLRNAKDVFFAIAAPALHIEIQQRMALFRAQSNTPPYVTSALLGVMEIALRTVTVGIDVGVVHFRQRQLQRKLRALETTTHSTTGPSTVAQKAVALEAEFAKWKQRHLRTCAAEILAEMAAEHCGIALVSIYVAVLRGNASIDLSPQLMSQFLPSQPIAWATQAGFEWLTDLVAIVIELKLGIPLVETIVEDRDRFMRWMILTIVVHASGLSISSLVVSRDTATLNG